MMGKKVGGALTMPLGARIFLLLAALLVVAVGAAVGITYLQGNRVAEIELEKVVEQSQLARRRISDQRFDILSLIAELIAGDADLVAYIETATVGDLGFGTVETVDRRSALDLLLERQEQTGFDFAVLMNPDGESVVRTDFPEAVDEDFSVEPLVAAAVETLETQYGWWADRGQLYEVVVTPMGRDFELVGFLMAGLRVTDRTAQGGSELTRSDVVYLLGEERSLIASSLREDQAAVLEALLASSAQLQWAEDPEQSTMAANTVELDVGGATWFAAAETLYDGAGQPLGMAVALTDKALLLGSYRRILNILLLAGGATLLLALVASLLFSRRILDPLSALANAAESAADGDYNAELDDSGVAELSQVSRAFNSLLSDLREKNDMEGYVAELSKHLPEPSVQADENTSSRVRLAPGPRPATVLAVSVPASATAAQVREYVSAIETLTVAGGGFLGGLSAQRVIAVFESGDGIGQAVRVWATAAKTADGLGLGRIAGGIIAGDVDVGEMRTHMLRAPIATGKVVQQSLTLCAEAPMGALFFAPTLGESMSDSGLKVATAKGRSGRKYYAVDRARVEEWLAGQGESPDGGGADATVFAAPSFHSSTSRELLPGMMFGDRFEILGQLGKGGMGVVYKARDLDLDDLVALKTLRGEAVADGELLSRLKDELKLARRITHPNVLRTYDFGEIDGTPFISMEYIRGLTLRYLLKRAGKLPYSAGLRLSRQLCSGLGAAHEVGVLHRDIKPENVIVEERGNAKLMDFGIARPIVRDQPGQTQPGMFIGTPTYASPEQLAGQEPDHRADIYAVGVVLCELFTGALPVTGSNTVELAMAHMQQPPKAPSELWPEIPERLEEIILKCLEKHVDDRFASAAALADALGELRA